MSVTEVWRCYNDGEPVFDVNGDQTGVKPPLRLVEQHWHADWRGGPTVTPFVSLFLMLNPELCRTGKPGGG
jgi:hypothetical protein